MREMKDSGIEWIGALPSDWTLTKISVLYSLRVEKVSDKDYPPLSVTMKAYRLMAYLKEEQFVMKDLESVLLEIFNEDVNVLENASASEKTGIRRLIRIYDWLKWGKTKEPSN